MGTGRPPRRGEATSQNYLATSEGSLGIDVEELILTLSRSSLRPSLFETATERRCYMCAGGSGEQEERKTLFTSFIISARTFNGGNKSWRPEYIGSNCNRRRTVTPLIFFFFLFFDFLGHLAFASHLETRRCANFQSL